MKKTEQKQTTKVCPNCKNTFLICLRSTNKKICPDCNTIIPWYLDDKQKPLIQAQR